MKPMLMHPHFPDIVAAHALAEAGERPRAADGANDNGDEDESGLSDPFLDMLARLDVAASRLW